MERHHHETAAGLKSRSAATRPSHELAELIVDRDAQGLEGARRRMGQFASPRGGDAGDELGKLHASM